MRTTPTWLNPLIQIREYRRDVARLALVRTLQNMQQIEQQLQQALIVKTQQAQVPFQSSVCRTDLQRWQEERTDRDTLQAEIVSLQQQRSSACVQVQLSQEALADKTLELDTLDQFRQRAQATLAQESWRIFEEESLEVAGRLGNPLASD